MHFLIERRSPTRFHFLAHYDTPALRRQVVGELLEAPRLPAYLLRPAALPLDSGNELDRLVAERYRPERTIGSVTLFALAE